MPIRVDHAKIRTKTILCCSSLNSLLLVLLIVVDGSAVYDVVSPIRSSVVRDVSDMISDILIYIYIIVTYFGVKHLLTILTTTF